MTPVFAHEAEYMNSHSYVIFLTLFWCTVHLFRSARQRARQGGTDRRDRGAGTVYAGRDRGRKFQKIGVQHDGKNLFCALFLIFSKNFSAFKTSVFACFHLFCEPLRARAFSLSLKKTALKFFLKKGLTRGYTRAIMETLQGGTPQDRRTASRDARTVRTVSTLRIVVAPPRTAFRGQASGIAPRTCTPKVGAVSERV